MQEEGQNQLPRIVYRGENGCEGMACGEDISNDFLFDAASRSPTQLYHMLRVAGLTHAMRSSKEYH